MKRFIRWQFWAPRLMAIVLALLAVQYGANQWVRSRLEASIEAATGKEVDVSAAHVSFGDGRLLFGGLRIANPHRPSQPLLDAEYCEFTVPWAPLLCGAPVEVKGRVTGLHFGDLRMGNSIEPPNEEPRFAQLPATHLIATESTRVAKWLDQLCVAHQRDWTGQFPSIEVASRLAEQSQHEMQDFDRRLRGLQTRKRSLQARAAAAANNPLRNQAQLVNLPADVAALEADIRELVADTDRLPDAIEAGRREVVAARARDAQTAQKCVAIATPSAEQLNAYLYHQDLERLTAQLTGWMLSVRQAFSNVNGAQKPTKQPTENNSISVARTVPRLLLRNVDLSGKLTIAGQPVSLQGTLTDFTTEPELLERPMRLRLKSTGSPQIDIRLTIDRSGAVPRDELLVDCREVSLPSSALGRSDGLHVNIGPARAALNVSLRLEGDSLTGDIQCIHSDAPLALGMGDAAGLSRPAAYLQEAIGGTRSVAARVSLTGNVSEPRCAVWSNLGATTAAAIDLAAERAAEKRAEELTELAQRRGDERLAAIERQVFEGQSFLLAEADESKRELGQFVIQSEIPSRLDAARFGRLPAHSLFR